VKYRHSPWPWFYLLVGVFVAFCVLTLVFCDHCGGKP
jgi:hypothetical protein